MNKFSPMEQIAYVPTHAEGDINHQDTEYGFVVEDLGERGVRCRYWRRPLKQKPELRTKSNGEITPRENLVRFKSVANDEVIAAWKCYVELEHQDQRNNRDILRHGSSEQSDV